MENQISFNFSREGGKQPTKQGVRSRSRSRSRSPSSWSTMSTSATALTASANKKRKREEAKKDDSSGGAGGDNAGGNSSVASSADAKKPCRRLDAGDFASEVSITLGPFEHSSSPPDLLPPPPEEDPKAHAQEGPLLPPPLLTIAKEAEQSDNDDLEGRDCSSASEDNDDDDDAPSRRLLHRSASGSSSEDGADVLSMTGDSLPPTSDLSPSLSDVSGLSGHDLHASETEEGQAANAGTSFAAVGATSDPCSSADGSEADTIYYGDTSSDDATPEVPRGGGGSKGGTSRFASAAGDSTPVRRSSVRLSSGAGARARRHLNFLPMADNGLEQQVPSMWDAED